MNNEDLIYNRLMECHLMFPAFGDRSETDVEVIARIMARQLSQWSENDINEAFDRALAGERFPVLKDILAVKEMKTAYAFDYGPLGFGGVYHEEHPYVQAQMAIQGQDISGHMIQVPANEARTLRLDAKNAPRIEHDDDELPRIERAGSGFRQIGSVVR